MEALIRPLPGLWVSIAAAGPRSPSPADAAQPAVKLKGVGATDGWKAGCRVEPLRPGGAWEIDASWRGEHRLHRTSVSALRMRNYTDKRRRRSSQKTG